VSTVTSRRLPCWAVDLCQPKHGTTQFSDQTRGVMVVPASDRIRSGEQFRGSREQACLSAWVGPAESTAVSQVVLRDLSSPTRGWRKLVDNSPRDKGMGATWSARAVRCSNTKQRELSLARSVPVSRGERVGQQALRNASSTNSGDLNEVFLTGPPYLRRGLSPGRQVQYHSHRRCAVRAPAAGSACSGAL
jgi:hypothetical protein